MGKIITLDNDNFEASVLHAEELVLVDFWATWCGPCHVVAPMLEQIANSYEGRVAIGKVDVDNNQDLAQRYGVRAIPTLLFFKNGEEVDRVIGVPPSKKVLTDKLEALL